MGQDEVLAALDYYGGIAISRDLAKFVKDPENVSKICARLRKRGKIESIESVLHEGIGGRPNIWIKY